MLGTPGNLPQSLATAPSGPGVALVTGGRRGIGRAICSELASRGFDVAFVDHVDEGAEETARLVSSFGRRAMFLELDISRTQDHDQIIAEITAKIGPIVCLVNNAGIQVSVRGRPAECR